MTESTHPITVEELEGLFGSFIPMEAVDAIIESAEKSPADLRPVLRQIAAQQDRDLGAEAATDYYSPCCSDAVTALFYQESPESFRCEGCGTHFDTAEELSP